MKCNLLLFCFLLLAFTANAQSKVIFSFDYDQYGGASATVKLNNKLFFSAFDSITGRELWCTDGTESGTFLVKDINPGFNSSMNNLFDYAAYGLNGVLYFKANDGVHGYELWRSDGTSNGTYIVKDMTPGIDNSALAYFTHINDTLYFVGGSSGTQLYRSDGTSNGTLPIDNFTIISDLVSFNGNLYFSAYKGTSGQELWKSNGTTIGTSLLKDLNGSFGASLPCNFHATNNALYFMAATNDGWELWKTTGSNASTVMVKDINPTGNGVLDSYGDAIIVSIDDTIYFRAQDGINGYQLWKSDGTNAGTVMLSNLVNGVYSSCTFPIVNGNVLVNDYLSSNFWEYNPVNGTTQQSFYPSFFYINTPNKFLFVDDQMFYVAIDSVYGCEVWKADPDLNQLGILQETHLTDNWFSGPTQNFNSVFGMIDSIVIFSVIRSPYNTKIQYFAYNVNQVDTCFYPSVIVPVPTSDTSVHIVWNRPTSTSNYEVRYKKLSATNWIYSTTNRSYLPFNNLDTATDYEFQLRSNCGSSITAWSPSTIYNSSFTGYDNSNLTILAERMENDTTVRLFWLRSIYFNSVQFRYRVAGTTTWNVVNSSNGFKRITGLQPNTFYEYQNRIFIGGAYSPWTFTSRYFYTESSLVTSINTIKTSNDIMVYPNPSKDLLYFQSKKETIRSGQIVNSFGQTLLKLSNSMINNLEIDLSSFESGVYFLQLNFEDNATVTKRFIKL